MVWRLLLLSVLALGSLRAQEPAGLTIAQVAADQRLWPKQVILKVPATVPAMVNGAPAGNVTLPAGQLVKLVRLAGETAHLEVNGSPFTLPATQTDLLAGAAMLRTRLLLQAQQGAAPATPATPPPVPGQKVLPAAAPAGATASNHVLGATLRNDLVSFKNNAVTFQKGDDLAGKKYVALYFSAHWCGPCRQFTPKLVQWYEANRGKAAQFEVVFVSSDTSAQMQAQYIKEDKMPWPAVDWSRATTKQLKQKYCGPGIPCLVVIDETGKVVSDSYEGKRYLGPGKVLQDLSRLIGANG